MRTRELVGEIAKKHAGFLLVLALAMAYAAAVEVYVKSSAFNTAAHIASSGAGFGVGYPLARWTISLQSRLARRLHPHVLVQRGLDGAESSFDAVRCTAVGLLIAGRGLAVAGWLLLITGGVLALVLVLAGVPVSDESIGWVRVTGSTLVVGLILEGGTIGLLRHSAVRNAGSADALSTATELLEEAGGVLTALEQRLRLWS